MAVDTNTERCNETKHDTGLYNATRSQISADTSTEQRDTTPKTERYNATQHKALQKRGGLRW